MYSYLTIAANCAEDFTVTLISVVMPIKSWQDYATAAIDSILQQSHEPLELILVTGQDHATVVKNLPADNRIRCIQRPSPGIVSALNTGIAAATGEFYARMDADDIARPDRLQRQLRYLQSDTRIDICGTTVEFFSDSPIEGGNKRYQHWLNQMRTAEEHLVNLFVECPLPHPTWMAHSSFWNKVGAYQEFDGPEDYEWILRAWLLGARFGKVDGLEEPQRLISSTDDSEALHALSTTANRKASPLLRWREHKSRLTYTDPRYSRKAFVELKAKTLANSGSGLGLHAGRGVWVAGTGRNARYWCDALRAQDVSVHGFVDLDSQTDSKQKRHLPIITYTNLLQQLGNDLVITAITNTDARGKLVTWFEKHDLILYKDYVLGG